MIGSPFSAYPGGGRMLLGSPTHRDNCRHGYGRDVRDMTSQTKCAYCRTSLVDDYRHWLLMAVDHVVPVSEGRRLRIPAQFTGDFINLVLCCPAATALVTDIGSLRYREPNGHSRSSLR